MVGGGTLLSVEASHLLASYADALWARHAIFPRDEPKERLRRRLPISMLFVISISFETGRGAVWNALPISPSQIPKRIIEYNESM